MGAERSTAAAALAAAAVLTAVAGLSAACGASEPVAEPSAGPSAPAASAGATSATSPSPSATPSPTRLAGAAADVPRAEIMRQLARRAERIAKQIPMAPAPTDVDPGSNRAIGHQEMLEFGFGVDQWPYLDALWQRESGWNHLAENPSSGAYGIPQSLPATKMAVVGSDWRTNPVTQIRWGLAYIAARYGSAQEAWAHSERVGWY